MNYLKDRNEATMQPTYRRMNTGKRSSTTYKILTTATTAFLLFGTSVNVLAQTEFQGGLNSVSITDAAGTNSPPTASFTYTQDGDSFTFDASGSSDSDGSITEYVWDFGDGTTKSGATVNYQFGEGTFPVTLTTVDNLGGVAIRQKTVTYSSSSFEIAVNFQPANVDVPSGYNVDSGLAFDETRGYGWTVPVNWQGTRDRDYADSPDQAYDTIIHADPTSVWEQSVANGVYGVTVVMGDPGYPSGTQYAQAEGQVIIDGVSLSQSLRWVEKTMQVEVLDGRLTMTFLNSSPLARLCWIKIKSI